MQDVLLDPLLQFEVILDIVVAAFEQARLHCFLHPFFDGPEPFLQFEHLFGGERPEGEAFVGHVPDCEGAVPFFVEF